MSLSTEQLRVEIAKALEYKNPHIAKNVFGGDRPVYEAVDFEDGGYINCDLPDWPNSIEAAWKLVDDIRKSGCEISINSDRNERDIFTVVILHLRNDNKGTGWTQMVNVEDENIPIAISRAWLIWHEEKEREG